MLYFLKMCAIYSVALLVGGLWAGGISFLIGLVSPTAAWWAFRIIYVLWAWLMWEASKRVRRDEV